MNVTFDRDLVIEAACQTAPGRFGSMCGVRVEPDNGRMIATNGRILAVVPCEAELAEGGHAPVVVPVSVMKAARKARRWPAPLLDINGKVRARTNDGWAEGEPMEDDYPDVMAVMPKAKDREGSHMVTLDAGLLAKLADAITRDGMVTLELPTDRKRVIVVRPGGSWKAGEALTGTYGLIMPCA